MNLSSGIDHRRNGAVETVLYGVDHKVFRPMNHDHEEEQLAYEALRKSYDAADEAALCGRPDTATPLLLAVGRLVARKRPPNPCSVPCRPSSNSIRAPDWSSSGEATCGKR